MKRLTFLLVFATFTLAASTFYLAHALKLERARTAQASASVASRLVGTIAQSTQSEGATPAAPAASITIPDAVPASEQQPSQPRLYPALDITRVAEIKAGFAPMMKDMMVYAGLNAYESERLLDLTAEAMLRGQEQSRECKSTPGCDIRAAQRTAQDSLRRELETILGPDKMQSLDTYDELQRVKSFRSQLPAGQELSETTATRLGTALAEERYRRVDRTESASAFNQRIYERAAGILTAEQLAFFRQRQESAFGRD